MCSQARRQSGQTGAYSHLLVSSKTFADVVQLNRTDLAPTVDTNHLKQCQCQDSAVAVILWQSYGFVAVIWFYGSGSDLVCSGWYLVGGI